MRTIDKIKAGLFEKFDEFDVAINQLSDGDYR